MQVINGIQTFIPFIFLIMFIFGSLYLWLKGRVQPSSEKIVKVLRYLTTILLFIGLACALILLFERMLTNFKWDTSVMWSILWIFIFVVLILGSLYPLVSSQSLNRKKNLALALKIAYKYFPYILLTILGLWLVSLETAYDNRITAYFGWDFTPQIYKLEGNIVERFQDIATTTALTYYFTFVYLIMYVVQVYLFIFYFIYKDDKDMVRMLTFAYFLNVVIALPFYILVPVNEAWTSNPAYTYLDYHPGFSTRTIWGFEKYHETQTLLYKMNGINNCFPSLHTSIVLTIPFVMLFAKKERYLTYPALFIAFSVFVSVMYLGIHWALDAVAGVLLAIGTAYISWKIQFDMDYPIFLRGIRWKRKGEP